MKKTVFITGAAGYIGTMLVRRFAAREDVERIIGLDKEPIPELIKGEPKLIYIEQNTSDEWEATVRTYRPDIVIHSAWQIREMYGDLETEWKWNVDGSDKVFDFAFNESSVERLVHFSTVASYGAFPENSVDHRYTEAEPFRQSEYLYAEEKRIVENHLQEKYDLSDKRVKVAIVRPAAITGPRGRFVRIRFGLQSALAGQLKGSFVYRLVSALVSFVPVTPKWLRQFIHEDDVVNIVEKLSSDPLPFSYEAFNICPPGPTVRPADMAAAVGKRKLPIAPWMVRIAFFVFWHLTRGRIPTGKGAWRGYSYPIAVDGSKLTRILGYHYKHQGLSAFRYTDGEYEFFVQPNSRRHRDWAV